MTTDPELASVTVERTTTRNLIINHARMVKRRRARFGAVIGLAIVAGAVVVAVWDPLDRGDRSMPSDNEVRQVWQSRRAEFEALRAMIAAESNLTVIGEDRVDDCLRDARDRSWGCPNARGLDVGAMLQAVHLPVDRYALYRQRLAAVGGDRAARRDQGISVGLFRSGVAPAGVAKSVVWSASPPTPIVGDTDRDRGTGRTVNYATLADGWYIEHESN